MKMSGLMKMSDLIEDAVRAVKRRAADPRYKIDMSDWHFQELVRDDQDNLVPYGPCAVCAAGARFADDLFGKSIEPYDLPLEEAVAARAIDFLRSGDVAWAAEHLELELPSTKNRSVAYWAYSPKGWYQDMETLIKDLRSNDE